MRDLVQELREAKLQKLSPQRVVGVLKKAGLQASVRTRKTTRSGFGVSKLSPAVVSVTYYDWENLGDRAEKFDDAVAAVRKAGLTVAWGQGSDRVTGDAAMKKIRQTGIAMVFSRA